MEVLLCVLLAIGTAGKGKRWLTTGARPRYLLIYCWFLALGGVFLNAAEPSGTAN